MSVLQCISPSIIDSLGKYFTDTNGYEKYKHKQYSEMKEFEILFYIDKELMKSVKSKIFNSLLIASYCKWLHSKGQGSNNMSHLYRQALEDATRIHKDIKRIKLHECYLSSSNEFHKLLKHCLVYKILDLPECLNLLNYYGSYEVEALINNFEYDDDNELFLRWYNW